MEGISLGQLAASVVANASLRLAPYWRSARYLVWGRKKRIRVSLSVFIVVRKDGTFALVELQSRPGAYGPLGGVLKWNTHDQELVHRVEFMPQFSGDSSAEDLGSDLRGFVDGRNLFGFVKWFQREKDRETAVECINRELREELAEISSTLSPPIFQKKDLKRVRLICEGPKKVPNFDYLQFHIFEFLEPFDSFQWDSFVTELKEFAKTSSKIKFVTADEIYAGRMKRTGNGANQGGAAIGHHAEYLLRSYSARPDLPPIYR